MDRIQYWTHVKTAGARRFNSWQQSLNHTQQHVLGKLDPFLLQDLLVAAGHEDIDYVNDLLQGFPLTETLSIGGLGTDIDGGQRSRGRPGYGGPLNLAELKAQCRQINGTTLQRAY
eukprot:11191341-Karenia_brevis.AAC.1